MHRRTALQRLAVLLGGVALSNDLLAAVMARATAGESPSAAGPELIALLDEMAETIIPQTDTPGAKAANVGRFIALVIEDCLKESDRKFFWAELERQEEACKRQFGRSFAACDAAQRTAFFTQLEAASEKQPDPVFWRMLKGLTLQGYFTSEIGMTQALAYDPVPGGWIADMKIDRNTKAWADMF